MRAQASYAKEHAKRDALPSAAAVASSAFDAASEAGGGFGGAFAGGGLHGGGGASPAQDDAQLAAEDDGLVAMQLARHIEGEVCRMVGDAPEQAGLFLSALAAGADTRWAAGSGGHSKAAGVRKHLLTVLDTAARANALLRAMTRDARLHPGLAPPLDGPVVGTDEAQLTPADEVERMVAGGWIPPRTFR